MKTTNTIAKVLAIVAGLGLCAMTYVASFPLELEPRVPIPTSTMHPTSTQPILTGKHLYTCEAHEHPVLVDSETGAKSVGQPYLKCVDEQGNYQVFNIK